MRSVKGKALRGKSVILTIILLLILHPSPFTLHPVLAADSTPSAEIKAGLQEIRKELDIRAASIAAKLKEKVSKSLQNKAYVGQVKASSENSLTVAADSGPKMVSINQDTVFESRIKGKTKFSRKTIAEDDYIAALGDIDETRVMTAKKIILLPTPGQKNPKTFLWGQVVSISDRLATLKDRDLKIVAASLPSSANVKLNDFVILTGTKNKNDIIEAGFSFIVPQGVILKPKKIATPSAGLATPSAKPTKKVN